MFHNPNKFPFTSRLMSNWRTIRDEFLAVAGDVREWHEKKLHDGGWNVYGLFDFPHGQPIDAHIRCCPLTSRLISDYVPGHGAAGFSVLRPDTQIRPHCGYAGHFLRCHLGLIVPEGDCGIEGDDVTRRWCEGQVMVLDDRIMHRAWNEGASDRVVLLLDFPEPE